MRPSPSRATSDATAASLPEAPPTPTTRTEAA